MVIIIGSPKLIIVSRASETHCGPAKIDFGWPDWPAREKVKHDPCIIIYVKDLDFNRGVLDINYVYKLIKNKGNILIKLSEIKEALRPFRNLLKQISEIRPIIDDKLQYLYYNTKQIYNPIVEII